MRESGVKLFVTVVDLVTVAARQLLALSESDVFPHHFGDQRFKGDLGFPTELFLRLRGVPKKGIHFGWPEVARIDPHYHLAFLKGRPAFRACTLDVPDFLRGFAFPSDCDIGFRRRGFDELPDAS